MQFDVRAFLNEPLRPASVATVSPTGRPALATMWYLFAEDVFWFHSPGPSSAFLRSAQNRRLVSVMVETFDPVGRVVQVRVTGPASIEQTDEARVHRIYDRYLGPNDLWSAGWREQQCNKSYVLWTVEPVTGAAVQYPELRDADGVFRWTDKKTFRAELDASAR